ncbi:MAG: hypothetical protein OHK0013_13400 [Sandaracinaceae bacterium]
MLVCAIFSPLAERVVWGTVSVDVSWWAAPIVGVPIAIGARRGIAAGVVAGLLAAGGVLGGVAPLFPHATVLFPGTDWASVTVGLVGSGLLAGLVGPHVRALAGLGALLYLFAFLRSPALASSPVPWACVLAGAGLGTLLAVVADVVEAAVAPKDDEGAPT